MGLIAAMVGAALFYLRSLQTPPLISQPPVTQTTVLSVENLWHTPVVYGYLPYWNVSSAQFPPSLTHVSYFTLPIQEDGSLLAVSAKNKDPGVRAFERGVLNTLKERISPNQKLELTIALLTQETIPTFLNSPQAQARTLADIQTLITTYPLDGINIDIEYNGVVDPALQNNFTEFIRKVHTNLKAHDPPLHVSVATYADAATIDRVTKPKDLVPYVDHIVVMTYDFHRRSSLRSGPVAPIYGYSEKRWDSDVMKAIGDYRKVVPSHKLLLGIPFYGYEWSVTDSNPYSFTLPKSGATATYKRVQEILRSGIAKRFWDPNGLSPYIEYERDGQLQRIYYEDEQSLAHKLELVNQAQLGGIAIWAIGYEGDTRTLWDTIDKHL